MIQQALALVGIAAVAIEDDHDRAAKTAEIKAAADAVDLGDGVVLVTDLFGGSPSNLSLPACAVQKISFLGISESASGIGV